jgi:hypothetical protein
LTVDCGLAVRIAVAAVRQLQTCCSARIVGDGSKRLAVRSS